MITIDEIMKALPHRYPFLMCDKILEYTYHNSVVGIKNVTINEPFFQGHFPNEPVMPGVLILESMAQIGGFVFYDNTLQGDSIGGEIVKIENAKFFKKVVPGDTLCVRVKYVEEFDSYGKTEAVAFVDNKKVAKADFTYHFSAANKKRD